MKRMKQWMGIMLSVMLAAGSLQIPVFAAEADAPAEVAAEAAAPAVVVAEAAEEAPEQPEAEYAEPDIETASVAAMDSGSADIVDSGTCGDSVYWTLDSEGTLTISGKGYMYGSPSWGDNEQKIFNIIIENGVMDISARHFIVAAI